MIWFVGFVHFILLLSICFEHFQAPEYTNYKITITSALLQPMLNRMARNAIQNIFFSSFQKQFLCLMRHRGFVLCEREYIYYTENKIWFWNYVPHCKGGMNTVYSVLCTVYTYRSYASKKNAESLAERKEKINDSIEYATLGCFIHEVNKQ